MIILHQRRLGILCLAVLGSILGALTGFLLGRVILLRATKWELAVEAHDLIRNADQIDREWSAAFSRFKTPLFPRCSNLEIKALQEQTFHSNLLKDIGRTHEGKFYCSAVLGRLESPYVEGEPTLILPSGLRVYTDVALMLASMSGDHGTILESGDVNAVLSPNAFTLGNRPLTSYMIVAVDAGSRRMTRLAGASLAVQPPWVLARGSEILAGKIFSSGCSDGKPFCAVASESLTDLWATSKATLIVYSAMGAFAGLSVGLVIALLYLRTTTLAYQLHRAIRRNLSSLGVVYQPILDSRTSRAVGAEALLRWTDQNGTGISPDVFVRVAEDNGFVGELTAFVVKRAISETSELLRQDPNFQLNINIAASDMSGSALLALLEREVLQAHIHSSQIALELTERSTADLGVARAAILRLRAAGYEVHIDDFGTGFSSLSYIDQLAVNAIKIDGAFTKALGTGSVTAPLLSQMIAMADSLGLEVIVEGVETEAQREYLASAAKVLRLQGYLFSRPLAAEALTSFVSENNSPIEARQPRTMVKDMTNPAALIADPRLL